MLGIGATLPAAGKVSAQINAEYRVPAAFLFNRAKFFELPPDPRSGPGDPITHGQVVGRRTLRGQPLGRPQIQAPGAAATCRILFTRDSESGRILTILCAVRGPGVRAIGESPRLADGGIAIQFTIDGGHVRFETNLAAADEQTLTVRSKLPGLAEGHTEIA